MPVSLQVETNVRFFGIRGVHPPGDAPAPNHRLALSLIGPWGQIPPWSIARAGRSNELFGQLVAGIREIPSIRLSRFIVSVR
jgi:hypothetical protein